MLFNAREYFADRQSTLKRNQFGCTIGGPIIRNQLFFFTDFQTSRFDGSTPVTNVVVPNSAFRSGDLSALCTAGFDSAGTCADASQQIRFPGGTALVPFNRVSSSQINSISQRFIDVWPTSTVAGTRPGTNLFSYDRSSDNRTYRFNPRVDYHLSASDRLFGVLHRQWGRQHSQPGIIPGPPGRQIHRQNDYALTTGWTHTLSPASVNDVRFGYMHRIGDRSISAAGLEATLAEAEATDPESPRVAALLNIMGDRQRSEARFSEAAYLYQRSLAIFQKSMGAWHPNVATVSLNLAFAYGAQNRFLEALPHYERALAIFEHVLSPEHSYVTATFDALAALYRQHSSPCRWEWRPRSASARASPAWPEGSRRRRAAPTRSRTPRRRARRN